MKDGGSSLDGVIVVDAPEIVPVLVCDVNNGSLFVLGDEAALLEAEVLDLVLRTEIKRVRHGKGKSSLDGAIMTCTRV